MYLALGVQGGEGDLLGTESRDILPAGIRPGASGFPAAPLCICPTGFDYQIRVMQNCNLI